MRILLDARTVHKQFSGVGNYVLELVRAFAALDEDVEMLLLVHGKSRLRDEPLDGRFRLVEAAFSHESHPLGDFWEQLVLPRRAVELGADLLHGPAFQIPTRGARVTKVVTVHDLVAFTHPETIPRRYAWYMRGLIRRGVRAADRVITVSESVRDDVIRILGAPASRIESIPHGVSSAFAPRGAEELARMRERFALANPYVLFVGNLEPRKNLPGLVEAFRRVRSRVSGALDLVVAGQVAWLSEKLLPALQAEDVAGRVRTLGYVPSEDLPALYAGAEVFVFPTFWEGFGLPVLEAMACGTPVVASNTSSIPEVAGEAAILVSPDSPEEIAGGIARVLLVAQERETLRRRGLERVREFTWDRTARATLASYRTARTTRAT